MEPRKFTIREEKQPNRCDICHQTDLFDPHTGVCERCKYLPIERLTNPDINSIQIIPTSRLASVLAASFSCFCISASLAILRAVFGPAAAFKLPLSLLNEYQPFLLGMLTLSLLNIFIGIAVNRWCSDRYNERLDYRISALGTFCSAIGLIGGVVGLIFAVVNLLRMILF
ncbi:MAG: hypothetical protein AB1489_17625 [Acidobacteriota bacterium]